MIILSHDESYIPFSSVVHDIHYIFDWTLNQGLKNKNYYNKLENLIVASAQVSEHGFGIPFMTGFRELSIKKEKYVHIVSCNTYAIVSLLQAFTGSSISNLEEADFIVVRRSEDVGNHERLISGHVVSRYLINKGTHHENDALKFYKLIGESTQITSSDITTSSQLFHSLQFRIALKKFSLEIQKQLENFPLIAKTSKFNANAIYDLGKM